MDSLNQGLYSHRAKSAGSNSLIGSPATVLSPSQHALGSNHDTAETSRPVTTYRDCQVHKPSYLNDYIAYRVTLVLRNLVLSLIELL